VTCDMIADPAVGVWKVVDVEDVDFFFGMRTLGPKLNLCAHHRFSYGIDSVGFDCDDVAKATDLVVGA